MALPVSSGYPNFSGNLITPRFAPELLMQFYCKTIFSEISTTKYSGQITKCGDQVTFFSEPEVEIRDYMKGQELTHDTPTTTPTTMTVDRGKYFSFLFDRIDQTQICNFDAYIEACAKRAAYRIDSAIDGEILASMWSSVAASNRGNTAGERSGAYPLGQSGADLQVTASNVNAVFSRIPAVLEEACVPAELGRPFVVVPPIVKQVIANSDLKAGYFAGANKESPYLSGVDKLLGGSFNNLDIITSNFVPSVIDPVTTRRAYLIVAGMPMATGFAAQVTESREIQDAKFFGTLYQGLMAYGFKTLYPKALVAGYMSFTSA